jgi:hypothetical protein
VPSHDCKAACDRDLPCPLPIAMPLSLPDELLLAIFKLLQHVKPRGQVRNIFAPLVLVCRQWNVSGFLFRSRRYASSINDPQIIALPLLYRDISVPLNVKRKNMRALFESLSAAERRGKCLWPHIRAMSLLKGLRTKTTGEEHSTPSADLMFLRDFLSRSTNLDTLRTWDTSGIVAEALNSTNATSATLLHLEIHEFGPSSLEPVGKLPRLRTLHIVAQVGAPIIIPSTENAWTLAELEELRWEEMITYERLRFPETIRFLAACRFPRLRRAKLCVGVDTFDGPRLLNSFLRTQSALASLDVVMSPSSYEAALASSTLACLSLQRCRGTPTPSLIESVPPTLRRLDLPVLVDRDPMEHSLAEVLQALASCPKSICEVHLALESRTDRYRTPDGTTFRLGGPLVVPKSMHADELLAIRESAVQLEALGIIVYDEDGRSPADYRQDAQ